MLIPGFRRKAAAVCRFWFCRWLPYSASRTWRYVHDENAWLQGAFAILFGVAAAPKDGWRPIVLNGLYFGFGWLVVVFLVNMLAAPSDIVGRTIEQRQAARRSLRSYRYDRLSQAIRRLEEEFYISGTMGRVSAMTALYDNDSVFVIGAMDELFAKYLTDKLGLPSGAIGAPIAGTMLLQMGTVGVVTQDTSIKPFRRYVLTGFGTEVLERYKQTRDLPERFAMVDVRVK